MVGVGRRGFWGEQQSVAEVKNKKPALKRLIDFIQWESFRPLSDRAT